MPFDGRILSGVTVLAAVVEGGSFVKAAELIGITDSGVSRAISRLEARLGVRLLDRTTRSVTLTGEGRRFYDEVKPHLNAIEDAAVVASGAASAVRGRLKVRSLLPAAGACGPPRGLLRALPRTRHRVRDERAYWRSGLRRH